MGGIGTIRSRAGPGRATLTGRGGRKNTKRAGLKLAAGQGSTQNSRTRPAWRFPFGRLLPTRPSHPPGVVFHASLDFTLFAIARSRLVAAGRRSAGGGKPKDPEPTSPDFKVQGEYKGQVTTTGGASRSACKSLPRARVSIRPWPISAGCRGDGWDKSPKRTAEGETKDGVVEFKGADHDATLKDRRVDRDQGRNQAGRAHESRAAKPDLGSQAAGRRGGTVRWRQGRCLRRRPADRRRPAAPRHTSKQKFGAGTYHIEFRTPFQPEARGQGRGNSGCYLQGRYEVQVLDSFGLDGHYDDCGGIYGIREPNVNMCLPPLSWQTYDIEFTPARYEDGKKVADGTVSVKHNGVPIHSNVKLPKATTAAPLPEGPADGPLYLQDHGNPVRYRNIWFLAKQ